MAKVKKKKSGQFGHTVKQGLLLLLVFLLGYMTASVDHVSWLKRWPSLPWLDQHRVSMRVMGTQQAALPKPKFEFYTLLVNESAKPMTPPTTLAKAVSPVSRPVEKQVAAVTEPALPLHTPFASETKPVAVETSTVKDIYWVQVASFRQMHEAERLKSTLSQKGFNVGITRATQQGMVWFRVVMGPFGSKLQAQQAQLAFVKREHTMGMIRHMDA